MVTRLLTILLILPALALAGQVSLRWDPNKETDLAGYKIYKSRTGKHPFQYVASTTATSIVLDNISTSLPQVFAVTAYNNMSSESSYSNRVKFGTPVSRQRARIGGSVTSGF